MSKFQILKELTDLKALLSGRPAWKQIGLALAVGYLLISYGGDGVTYLSTFSRLAKEKVRENVPLEFELERARTMINDLIPEVRKNMLVVAQEEVGIESIRQDVLQTQADLDKQRENILKLRADMNNVSGAFLVGTRVATSADVREELTHRFNRYQVAESTLAAKSQLLAAREKSLEAARAKLEGILHARRDLELQIEELDSRIKTRQTHALAGQVEVNDSQVARCKELVNDLRARLAVADRLLASNGDFIEVNSTSLVATEDIAEQIDGYFANKSRSTALAAARK
jgi:hypothetical protein